MSTTTTTDGSNNVNGTSNSSSRRAKDLFGDCALVEIIHLHDCFRGALRALEVDVSELCREISAAAEPTTKPLDTALAKRISSDDDDNFESRIVDLERRVAGRFTVIWSVFRAHSAAEDEFIWPALKAKQVALPDTSPCHSPRQDGGGDEDSPAAMSSRQRWQPPTADARQGGGGEAEAAGAAEAAAQGNGEGRQEQRRERAQSMTVHCIEQEEYEEDHADEERMFNSINGLLSNLREELLNRRRKGATNDDVNKIERSSSSLRNIAQMLSEGTGNLMRHLMAHLEKEETHCMPLVAQYLTKAEINDLVGKIMVRSSPIVHVTDSD